MVSICKSISNTMGTGMIWRIICISSAYLFPFYLLHSTQSQPSYYHIVNNTPKSWFANFTYRYDQTILLTNVILLRNVPGTKGAVNFTCGLFSYYDGFDYEGFVFGIYVSPYSSKLVWSSNQNKPVETNVSLLLSGDGLMLKDADGTLVWSTNTKGRSVAGMNLTESGNLVLFDTNNSTVWQSFDHPTDTLLLGQKLYSGQKLTAIIPSTNLSERGLYSLSLTNQHLFGAIESDSSSSVYFQILLSESSEANFATISNGSFDVFTNVSNLRQWSTNTYGVSPLQHLTLDSDGHLRVYDWVEEEIVSVSDILTPNYINNCSYPLVCGSYGICSPTEDGNAFCSCPQIGDTNLSYFTENNRLQTNLGCSETNPLSCEYSAYQKMVQLENVTHMTGNPDIRNTDPSSCQIACLKNCSCKAAMFDSSRSCYLASKIFSLKNVQREPNYSLRYLFLKVQDDSRALTAKSIAPATHVVDKSKRRHTLISLGWSLGASLGLLLIFGTICIFLLRKKEDADDSDEDYVDEASGMPRRYSYENLIVATDNFSKKLGQGGFGSVFEGTLSNDTMVAVKCLDGLRQIKESFLSEVKTIGSIHHVNLVRLIGYCTKKPNRLLVYEFMCNGSLDKWIFEGSQNATLDWKTRKNIILDIAKGLAYLHDGCRQKILHLDIKPQNILLDKNFRAKVSDFGLSKLIDRDQSQVVTIMKGTPGYMAPEWLNSVITEKVDVYSFGIVVLEILCGRKNVDRSQPEEDMHLLSRFKRKAEEDQLLDMIDKNGKDMLANVVKVMKMMKVAAWCLQNDSAKRPAMSVVVKVLEGSPDVEEINVEYDFSFPPVSRRTLGPKNGGFDVPTPILPSTLSGPR